MVKAYRSCLFLAALIMMGGCSDSDSKSSEPENTGDCKPAATRCFSGNLQTCSADKVWENTPCTAPKVCSDASGTAECAEPAGDCEPAKKRCHEGVMQTCSTNKVWEDTPCNAPQVCSEASGTAECANPAGDCESSQKRCHEGVMQTCSANKVWEDTPCDAPQVCSEASGTAECANAASKICTAGEIKCEDDGTTAQLMKCNESGTAWETSICRPSDISGTRLTCRNAETCSTYICTTQGMLFNSSTKSCEPYQHASGCKEGKTYCNSDTNYLYECLSGDSEALLAATDCSAEGKTCTKISDEEAACIKEECTANFCEGETLVFCTSTHQIEYEGDHRHVVNCAESDRVCDLDDGEWMCTEPCSNESAIFCNSEDDTHKTYYQCANQHYGLPKTCPGETTCQNIDGVEQCK